MILFLFVLNQNYCFEISNITLKIRELTQGKPRTASITQNSMRAGSRVSRMESHINMSDGLPCTNKSMMAERHNSFGQFKRLYFCKYWMIVHKR